MNFLSNLVTFGTIVDKKPAITAGNPRDNFVKNATKQIDFLNNGGHEGQNPWFTEDGGKIRVSLRHGFKNLPLDAAGRVHVLVADKAQAIALFTGAIEAVKVGEFDQLFTEHKIVRKSTKAKAVAAVEAV